jgi:hypothetical protein
MAASQNEFSYLKLSLHKKTNIHSENDKKHKKIITFIYYLRSSSLYNTSVKLCEHRFVMKPLQRQPLCNSTLHTHI